MIFLRLTPAFLAVLALGAHFLRAGNLAATAAVCATIPVFLIPRRWAARVAQTMLLVGSMFWVNVLVGLVGQRQLLGLGWSRLAIILGVVAALTAASALLFEGRRARQYYRKLDVPVGSSYAAFWIAAILLAMVQLKVSPPMLLAERFVTDGGWVTILVLSAYAAWVAEMLLDPKLQARTRSRLWGFFSIVFFFQLALGLVGIDALLMTGELHLPVPAMIVGGPLYRGAGFFMPILFGVTVLIVGPAWCSHLCYIGAWDNKLARKRRPSKRSGRWKPWLRVATLAIVVCAALLLRGFGVPSPVAAVCGLTFGLVGVSLMLFWSRRTGTMAHCSWFCPMGLVAATLGRLSPHRIRLSDACVDCGSCTRACRFDALSRQDIKNRKPGFSCTLCGDCLGSCKPSAIEYRLLGLSPPIARAVFITLVASLHAVFLGVARI